MNPAPVEPRRKKYTAPTLTKLTSEDAKTLLTLQADRGDEKAKKLFELLGQTSD
jgi:hypothetical protein